MAAAVRARVSVRERATPTRWFRCRMHDNRNRTCLCRPCRWRLRPASAQCTRRRCHRCRSSYRLHRWRHSTARRRVSATFAQCCMHCVCLMHTPPDRRVLVRVVCALGRTCDRHMAHGWHDCAAHPQQPQPRRTAPEHQQSLPDATYPHSPRRAAPQPSRSHALARLCTHICLLTHAAAHSCSLVYTCAHTRSRVCTLSHSRLKCALALPAGPCRTIAHTARRALRQLLPARAAMCATLGPLRSLPSSAASVRCWWQQTPLPLLRQHLRRVYGQLCTSAS